MAILTIKLGETISSVISKINANFAELANSISAIPTKLSELTNDANYVKTTDAAFENKVDKVSGKGLSTNDYTTAEKQKLAALNAPATIAFTADNFTASGTQHTFTTALNGATPVCVMRDGVMCVVEMTVNDNNVTITADEAFAGYIVTI